jgi:mannose PTS system EIIA component
LTPGRQLATPGAREVIEGKLTVPGLGSRAGETARTEPPLAPSFRSATDRLYSDGIPCNGVPNGRECAPFRAVQRGAREELGMIGLVLVTHGRLAIEFRSALEHVVGPQRQIEAITIGPDDDVEQCRKNILDAVKRVDSGEGVAILTDMFGGTPSNLAISVMSQPKVEVLAGINLPMLIKLAKIREISPLQDAVAAAQEAGRKYCTIASRVLNGK